MNKFPSRGHYNKEWDRLIGKKRRIGWTLAKRLAKPIKMTCLPEYIDKIAEPRVRRVGHATMLEWDSQRLRYEQWVRLYAPELYRYAYHLIGRRHLAEDLLQETFFQAWKSIGRQKDERLARGWLFQILRHRYLHLLRDMRRRPATALTDQSDEQPPAQGRLPLDRLAEEDALTAALGKLSPALRETFLMVFSQGLTCRETALALHIPLGTVLSRLDTARRSLRGTLAPPPPRPAAKCSTVEGGPQ